MPRPATEKSWPGWSGAHDDAPPTQTSLPVAAAVATDPARGGAPPRRPRRRIVVIACAAAVLAAAGLVVGLLPSGGPVIPTVPAAVKSALPAVGGDVYVLYRGGKQASAEVYGEITKAANGEVAELYAQQFPFSRAPVQAGSVIVHPAGGTAGYQFQVTPTLATRYRVELFQSSTASAPLATSPVVTVYVATGGTSGNGTNCGRPVCRQSILTTTYVPPSAMRTEMSKPWYAYFGVNLSTGKEPPPPQWLTLEAGSIRVSAAHRVSADEFTQTVTFSFRIGDDAYYRDWNSCIRDTQPEDGIGLPGHHGCGDPRVLDSASYLG